MCEAECLTPIVLTVHGAPDAGAPAVTTSLGQGSCSVVETAAHCTLGQGPGTYSFDVSAEGYVSQHLEVTVPAFTSDVCSCGYTSQLIDVTLQR
jgi:hypothetical protein